MSDWMKQTADAANKPGRFRDLTSSIDSGTVRQARTGQRTKRKQVSQTIHFNESIAADVKAAVEKYAEEWGVPKNDVWQYVTLLGLQAVEDGEQPNFRKASRKLVLPTT
jgi:hypothetical protein